MESLRKRIAWRVDLIIYRLFYWRWYPRIKGDADLAYIFSKMASAWTDANPPRDPETIDIFIDSFVAVEMEATARNTSLP
jgi:hypothetical protein